jgi:hypothetical protein
MPYFFSLSTSLLAPIQGIIAQLRAEFLDLMCGGLRPHRYT